MPEVFTHQDQILQVGDDWLDRLKDAASRSPLRRARLCMHLSDQDRIHEMLIVLCSDVLFRPHRHLHKTESFHIIEGDLHVMVFDDLGNVIRTIHMGPPGSGRVMYYRLSASHWHAILPNSPFVVFYETTDGPFRPDEALFAPWAPEEPDELRRFLEERRRDATERKIP
jgi:cupin fold WbuC family metalloprotein